jgi:uncharacterized RDD family membrane protein YckC
LELQARLMETIQLTDNVLASAPAYASFGSRILAKLIDDFLVSICFLLLDLAARKSFVVDRGGHTQNSAEATVFFILICLYSAVMESSWRQATLGKRIVGIFVMEVDGTRPSFGRSLLRAVAQLIVVGYPLAVFTKRRQALHDLLASTVVVPGTL